MVIYGIALLGICTLLGLLLGDWLGLIFGVDANVGGIGTVSYTHLTLPTTPYV